MGTQWRNREENLSKPCDHMQNPSRRPKSTDPKSGVPQLDGEFCKKAENALPIALLQAHSSRIYQEMCSLVHQ